MNFFASFAGTLRCQQKPTFDDVLDDKLELTLLSLAGYVEWINCSQKELDINLS